MRLAFIFRQVELPNPKQYGSPLSNKHIGALVLEENDAINS